MDNTAVPMTVYAGISGSPAIAIFSVRTEPESKVHRARWEFIEGPTEASVVIAAQKRVAELEADQSVVRIILSVVSSERRREAKEIFGKIVVPFNRINGSH